MQSIMHSKSTRLQAQSCSMTQNWQQQQQQQQLAVLFGCQSTYLG
jgi:hypothetical protein